MGDTIIVTEAEASRSDCGDPRSAPKKGKDGHPEDDGYGHRRRRIALQFIAWPRRETGGAICVSGRKSRVFQRFPWAGGIA